MTRALGAAVAACALSCVELRPFALGDARAPAVDGGGVVDVATGIDAPAVEAGVDAPVAVDRGVVDATVAVDTGARDVGAAMDVGAVVDVGPRDAGTLDAGVRDVGVDVGTTPFGAGNACATSAQCGGNGCITAPGWAGGYCTRRCAVPGDCGPGGACVDDGKILFCARSCLNDGDCRSGYICLPVDRTLSVCYPRCTANPGAICGELRCDPATDECGDVACVSGATCSTGSRCVGNQCECTASTDCGPNRACIGGLCGCANDTACAPLGTCRSDGACR